MEDVMRGESGSLRNGGHVLWPCDKIKVDGFRRSSQGMAAFRLSGEGNANGANTARRRRP